MSDERTEEVIAALLLAYNEMFGGADEIPNAYFRMKQIIDATVSLLEFVPGFRNAVSTATPQSPFSRRFFDRSDRAPGVDYSAMIHYVQRRFYAGVFDAIIVSLPPLALAHSTRWHRSKLRQVSPTLRYLRSLPPGGSRLPGSRHVGRYNAAQGGLVDAFNSLLEYVDQAAARGMEPSPEDTRGIAQRGV